MPTEKKYRLGTPISLVHYQLGTAPYEAGTATVMVEDGFVVARGHLTDTDIANRARENNEKTWETGDVFELFFQVRGHEDYYEAHVTPENVTLQLHIADYRTFRGIPHEEKVCDIGELGKAAVHTAENFWDAEIRIPFDRIGLTRELLAGSRFAIARYNYNRNWDHPEITASAAFGDTVHRPDLWPEIEL